MFSGCKASSPSQYVSPRVTGTVVDSGTHQPLSGVRVRRATPNQQMDPNVPPRGGQAMSQESPMITGADGTFVVESVRDFVMFRKVGWYVVRLTFERAGYEPLATNFTPSQATTTPQGEPLVKTGDIALRPLAK
ncbi:MAG TPA: hypothetical protein VLU94_02535 [Candidatus Nitrosotalea sp.]|nr:hypothetical protein [Candidatus Nitrosotalea sp.]